MRNVVPLAEQVAAVEEAARAARFTAAQSPYPAEREITLRRADALDAAAESLRYLGSLRKVRRPRKR